ncbi:MAG: hypothetical protein MJ067_02895, partial [Oscillospiraceae bacterium]|nr:hypothetical protein [Oscillospiraceae bacterium]
FFLGPLFGYKSMFAGHNLFMHLINPLMALGAFFLPCCGEKLSPLKALWGLSPVAVYGSVYLYTVVIKEIWPDFYGFNMGGRWYISYPVMMLFTIALSLGLNRLRNFIIRKSK